MTPHLVVFVTNFIKLPKKGSFSFKFISMRKLFYSLFFCSTFVLASPNGSITALEEQLKQAIYQNNAEQIQSFLSQYQQQTQQDPLLLSYAEAKLASLHQDYALAIRIYRKMLSERPALTSIRMELAKVLFADRQDRAARLQFDKVKSVKNLPDSAYQQIDRYIDALNSYNTWQIDASVSYLKTNNVENVSSATSIENTGFIKGERMLPQKAHGFRYGVGVNRELNVGGNHFVTTNGRFSGVHYWDNQDYSEKSLYASFGYRYHSALQAIGFTPFFEQNWLGSPRYSKNYGAVADFRRELTAYWAISGSFSHTQKRYVQESVARRHNGYINGISLSLSYQAKPNWLLFGGMEGSVDRSKDKAESSLRRGVNIGSVWELKEFVSRVSLRYVKRDFRAENFYFPTKKRQDKEYSLNVSVWHNRLQWQGFVPKLNYRYRKIDSNIPEFYSRKSGEWFVSVEKDF